MFLLVFRLAIYSCWPSDHIVWALVIPCLLTATVKMFSCFVPIHVQDFVTPPFRSFFRLSFEDGGRNAMLNPNFEKFCLFLLYMQLNLMILCVVLHHLRQPSYDICARAVLEKRCTRYHISITRLIFFFLRTTIIAN